MEAAVEVPGISTAAVAQPGGAAQPTQTLSFTDLMAAARADPAVPARMPGPAQTMVTPPAMGARAMETVARMQSAYRAEASLVSAQVGPVAGIPSPHPGPAAGPVPTSDQMMTTLVDRLDAGARMQQQLAEFVMLSSVSSSFGRNLNMFLRGQ